MVKRTGDFIVSRGYRITASDKYIPNLDSGWYGFDLDGTLVKHEGGGVDTIGEPVPEMWARLVKYISMGRRCKIFTARADDPVQCLSIQNYLKARGMPPIEVTNKKDYLMVYCYDDRARQVLPNLGIVVGE